MSCSGTYTSFTNRLRQRGQSSFIHIIGSETSLWQSGLSVGWPVSVVCMAGRSAILSYKGGKLRFPAPIIALDLL